MWTGEGRRMRPALAGVVAAVVAASLFMPAASASTDVLYVTGTNKVVDNVFAHRVTNSGALTPLAGPFTAGDSPEGLAITPDAGHLYIANFVSQDVSGFTIEGAGGAITPTAGSPYPAGTPADIDATQSVSVAPNGRNVYASNFGSNPGRVNGYDVSPSGVLTASPGSPFAAGAQPVVSAVTPDGSFLYVAGYSSPAIGVSDSITGYAVADSGELTELSGSPFAAGDGPQTISVTPDGRHLYVANGFDDTLSAYAIGDSGALTPLPGGPIATGDNASGQAISPDGGHLYVTSFESNTITAYAIGADGTLSQVPGSPFASGPGTSRAVALTMTADGSHLYVAHRATSNIDAFEVADSGALTLVAGSPFPSGVTEPSVFSVAITPDQPPVASFTAKAPKPGSPARFDATGTVDPDGDDVRYDWDFGDGTTLEDGGPTPNHRYAAAGDYAVSLTTTDEAGCSTEFVFTGQTAYCNGGPDARTASQLRVKAQLKIVGVKHRKKKGKAKLSIETNVGGHLHIDRSNKVRRSNTVEIERGAHVDRGVVAAKKFRQQLRENGRLKVNARIVFKPFGSKEIEKRRDLKLKKN